MREGSLTKSFTQGKMKGAEALLFVKKGHFAREFFYGTASEGYLCLNGHWGRQSLTKVSKFRFGQTLDYGLKNEAMFIFVVVFTLGRRRRGRR